ncbi:MAG: OmpH family outer membrane protein, partial [Saprospiraceae bacterium]|nr:OmpH family outer membrane protein [Saprospiraceae bacterium]
LWDYAAEVACTRCTKIRIEDPNPPLLKELKSAYYEGQQRLYKKQDQTKEKVNVQFDKMVTYLAQERNYTHVLDKSCLFYFDEIRTEDITDKVTEMLGLRE